MYTTVYTLGGYPGMYTTVYTHPWEATQACTPLYIPTMGGYPGMYTTVYTHREAYREV